MSMSEGSLPFDLNELGSGAIRVLVQPATNPLVKTFKGWFAQVDPYDPVVLDDPIIDLGATSGPSTFDQALTVSGLTIEQQDADVLERVSQVVWTMTIPMADINVANLTIFSNAKEAIAVAAAAGAAPFDFVPFGSFSGTVPYRILFVAQKLLEQGVVTEPTTLETRGRWDAVMAYRAKLTAGTQSMSFGKGALVSMPITMKLFPEPGETQGEEYGGHLHERAATISLT